MPAGLQVVNWFKVNAGGSGFEALAPRTGDSATFFNVPQGTAAFLGEVWAVDNASPAVLSLKASRFHDQQLGIVVQVPDGSTLAPANRAVNLSPAGIDQPIFPSDVLDVSADMTAADDINVTLVLYYPDLPGISARLATAEFVRSAAGNLVGIQATITPGTGDWGATVALNASDNRLHANRDYAVLGLTSQAPLAAVGISGTDTGNLRVGGPVLADPEHDATMFLDFARAFGLPLVPIINSNNAGATLIQAADTTPAATPITVLLAELSQPFSG
jgi:hypothetical protein